MKALAKYSLSLFILLLIGYSQLAAPLYRGIISYPPTKKFVAPETTKIIDVNISDLQTAFIAEEEEDNDDRISFKKPTVYSSVISFSFLPGYLFPRIQSYLSHVREFPCVSVLKPTYILFQVFRL